MSASQGRKLSSIAVTRWLVIAVEQLRRQTKLVRSKAGLGQSVGIGVAIPWAAKAYSGDSATEPSAPVRSTRRPTRPTARPGVSETAWVLLERERVAVARCPVSPRPGNAWHATWMWRTRLARPRAGPASRRRPRGDRAGETRRIGRQRAGRWRRPRAWPAHDRTAPARRAHRTGASAQPRCAHRRRRAWRCSGPKPRQRKSPTLPLQARQRRPQVQAVDGDQRTLVAHCVQPLRHEGVDPAARRRLVGRRARRDRRWCFATADNGSRAPRVPASRSTPAKVSSGARGRVPMLPKAVAVQHRRLVQGIPCCWASTPGGVRGWRGRGDPAIPR